MLGFHSYACFESLSKASTHCKVPWQRGVGIKGIILTATAGIISIGPIYAWYPLLKELREKGVGDPLIAIFLGNGAVKPFLLPMMIAYFGWTYVLILTVFTILGSLGV